VTVRNVGKSRITACQYAVLKLQMAPDIQSNCWYVDKAVAKSFKKGFSSFKVGVVSQIHTVPASMLRNVTENYLRRKY
jgi:hypothetical protein